MTEGTARAWGWVSHLRDGGTVPWADWSAGGDPTGATVPGAQQLELLRRLNQAGSPRSALAERVLRVDPPRRGRHASPLAGGPAVPGHGPRPIDPGVLGDEELLRIAVLLLAADLATGDPAPPKTSWPRPWRTRYRLVGDPEHVAALRRHLVARGRPGGGVGPVLVIGTDTGRMLLDVWTAQSLRHGSGPWRTWLARRARQGGLPWSADLTALAGRNAGLPTTQSVHVVLETSGAARLVGIRRWPPPPSPYAAEAVDLGRRVCGALRPLAIPPRRARLVRAVLRPALADVPGLPLVLPDEHRGWVRAEAERLHRRLTRARYPVHGDPAMVLPVERTGVVEPDVAATLALATRMLLAGTLRGPLDEPKEDQ